jgi:hypothetical protein
VNPIAITKQHLSLRSRFLDSSAGISVIALFLVFNTRRQIMPEVFKGKHGFYPISYETYKEMKKNHQRLLTAYREVKNLWRFARDLAKQKEVVARQSAAINSAGKQLVDRVRALYADAAKMLDIVLKRVSLSAAYAPIEHATCGWQLPVADVAHPNGTREVSYESLLPALARLLPHGIRFLRQVHRAYLVEYTRVRRPVATEAEVCPVSFAKVREPFGPEEAVKEAKRFNRSKLREEEIAALHGLLSLDLPVTAQTNPMEAL